MTKGFYNGFTFGVPTPIGGVGGGLYADSYGTFILNFTTVRPTGAGLCHSQGQHLYGGRWRQDQPRQIRLARIG